MDPALERYLNERGIPHHAIVTCGASYEGGCIRWPRVYREGGASAGWKCRDLTTGRFFADPSGIPHSATSPWVVPDVLPATGAMICEGESDTMRLAVTDLPGLYSSDVICIPGVQAFPAEWVSILRGYERVHVFADADAAGSLLPDQLAGLVPGVRVVRLPAGDDVCSFLLKHTEEDLTRLYLIAPLHIAPVRPIRNVDWVWDAASGDSHRDKLVRLVSEDVVLKRHGREFKGLCPFHDENTASFYVNAEKGLYRCYGCNAKGDSITWLRERRDMSFKEALQHLERM